jgi:hypothetical protein
MRREAREAVSARRVDWASRPRPFAGLDPTVRRRLNHPNAVWWRWKRSTASSAPAPARRHAAIPLGVSQAQIARASDAIYGLLKFGNRDCLVLARAALMAAISAPQKRTRNRQRSLLAMLRGTA